MKKTLLFVAVLFVFARLGAQQWVPVSVDLVPANFDFQSVSVVNADVVWALADSIYGQNPVAANNVPAVLRTTDGGLTWDYYRVQEAKGRHAWSIEGIDANTAIFTTNQFNSFDTRPIFKTTDGGVTWKKITPPSSAGGLLVHFFDLQNGVAINRGSVATTTNGGETWSAVTAPNTPLFANGEFNLLYFTGNYSAQVGDRVWVGTSKGRIYRTIDRGYHWTMTQVAGVEDNVLSIAFSDSLHGVASAVYNSVTFQTYPASKLFATADGGVTWTPIDDAPMSEVTTIGAVPGAENHYFVGSFLGFDPSEPNISLNKAGLDSESWDAPVLDSVYLNCLEMRSPTVGYAAGWSSRVADQVSINAQEWNRNYIWKWTGSVPTQAPGATQMLALKVYPNPTSDWLFWELPTYHGPVNATLSRTDGQVVFSGTLTDNRLNVRSLPAGTYTLKVQTADGVAVQKVVRQ